ncbi:filamentous hemagglutinin N-terminal domain-containing protein [Rhabdochromatium marinum]|uniref:two-partner secretion domain-containing protein n=1 Tax=Rhabdochromatium marinum TaxID=48729 RepID=UPI00190604FA|nr:filamentous hemagglutinin N-terminal domain-containing protein [Rhabdochromatium marinum]MBK1648965.1 hypothetical protein [Rhabdochromatium marinum]
MIRFLPPSLGLSPAVLITSICWLVISRTISADIATDGSLGSRVELTGPDMQIGAELGQTRGNNLFHSFQRFNIPTAQSATFTGPDHIQNVIGRVTGGQVSNIDGQLRSEVGQADVFLINPSGVVMGPNATVDVPASLHVSTASELRFKDGSHFSATDPGASSLTLAAPEAFGFLGQQSAANLQLNGSQLQVQPGETLSLSAGDIAITGTQERTATLTAASGSLQLEAVGEARAEVSLDASQPFELESAPRSDKLAPPHTGQLTLTDTKLETSGDHSGQIQLLAGPISMTRAKLIVNTLGEADSSAGIVLASSESLMLDDCSRIASQASNGSTGQGGAVTIRTAGIIEIFNGAEISTTTMANGNAGDLNLISDATRIDGSGAPGQFTGISSLAYPEATGNSGAINLVAHASLDIVGGGYCWTGSFGAGDAGPLDIQTRILRINEIGLTDQISGIASQANAGTGNAGNIRIEVADQLRLMGEAEISASTRDQGQGGTIAILGPNARIDLLRGGLISASTFGSGDAGDIDIDAHSLRIDRGGESRATSILSQAEAGSTGDAGRITLNIADALKILNGGQISSTTLSNGDGGPVSIHAGSMLIDDNSQPDMGTGIGSVADRNSTGDAGNINLWIDGQLDILDGAVISSSTYAAGDGADIHIHAGSARLDDSGNPEHSTGIGSVSNIGASGRGGNVAIEVVDHLDILAGAQISAGTYSAADAGTISVSAYSARFDGDYLPEQFTGISTQSNLWFNATGNANNIRLRIDGRLAVINGAAINSSAYSYQEYAGGDAGTLDIRADDIWLSGGNLLSESVGPLAGQTGDINLVANDVTLLDDARISIRTERMIEPSSLTSSDNSMAHRIQVSAARLRLDNSRIDAESTGRVPAAMITIDASTIDLSSASQVTTNSKQADAGPIEIAGGYLWLQDSQITTTAEGPLGNGGDIYLSPKQLILDGGFIQANTAAIGASGGDINIGGQALIASHDQIEIGGLERADFIPGSGQNVTQAAAPLGIQGDIALATPDLDITATLVPLRTPFEDPNALLSDLCQIADTSNTSALVKQGRGGVPPDASGSVSAMLDSERLKRLLRDN